MWRQRENGVGDTRMGENVDTGRRSRTGRTVSHGAMRVPIALRRRQEAVDGAAIQRGGWTMYARYHARRVIHDCFTGGVAGMLAPDVTVIRPVAITASAGELCAVLPIDAAQAAVPPINGHDSVLQRSRYARLHLHGAQHSRSGNQSPHCDAERYLSRYNASPRGPVVRMTNGVNSFRAVKATAGFASRLRRQCGTHVAALVW